MAVTKPRTSDRPTSAAGAVDGRRLRRERGRTAVVDAMVDLVREGRTPPTAQEVADRAGVSASSLFRYFTDLDELREQTVHRFLERYADLFEVPAIGEGPLEDRIARFVTARLALYDTIAPVSRLARARSLEHPELASGLHEVRQRMREQARDHFDPELAPMSRAVRDDTVAVLITLTSFESWDQLSEELRRTTRQIRRAWVAAVEALLAPERR